MTTVTSLGAALAVAFVCAAAPAAPARTDDLVQRQAVSFNQAALADPTAHAAIEAKLDRAAASACTIDGESAAGRDAGFGDCYVTARAEARTALDARMHAPQVSVEGAGAH